jgi:hypothetical protein
MAAQYDDFRHIFKEFRCQGMLSAGISNIYFSQNLMPATLSCQAPIAPIALATWVLGDCFGGKFTSEMSLRIEWEEIQSAAELFA